MADEPSPVVHSTPAWSIQIAPGWRAEDRGDHVAVLSSAADTLLRLTTFDPVKSRMTARQWVEAAARVHLPRGRPVVDVACGNFSGYRTEFAIHDSLIPPVGQDLWLRGWMLERDGVPLDVTYTCPLACAGRDDEAVASMLDTLRCTATGEPRGVAALLPPFLRRLVSRAMRRRT
jgi:hypothetical protein